MPDSAELSEAKRALLGKYLRGELPQSSMGASTLPRPPQGKSISPTPLDARVSSSVVQPGGAKRPLFYLHVHWQGGAFYCFNLAKYLGADQPFYVLEPYKFDGLPVLPTLEDMATAYIEAMRAVQQEGPYILGGFCGGGLIAFEMAHQLRAMGQSIDLLYLIEPRAGPAPFRLIGPKLTGGFIRSIGSMAGLKEDQQLDWFLRLRHYYLTLRYSQYKKASNFSLNPSKDMLRQDWIGKFVWVISKYVPRQYHGMATYFWAEEKPGKRRPGWGRGSKADNVEIHIIPGTHDSCRTEHLPGLAEHLRECLNEVQEGTLSEQE
jgi:pimeloyl-ACP methyl ester carboxylesterase